MANPNRFYINKAANVVIDFSKVSLMVLEGFAGEEFFHGSKTIASVDYYEAEPEVWQLVIDGIATRVVLPEGSKLFDAWQAYQMDGVIDSALNDGA